MVNDRILMQNWPMDIIPVQFGNLVPTLAVELRNTGYVLHVNPEFWNSLSDDGKRVVLQHEMAHVIRGDLLSHQIREDRKMWNIACDCVINTYLDVGLLPVKVYTLDSDQLNLPDDLRTNPPPSAADVYDFLKSNRDSGNGEQNNCNDNNSGDGESDDSLIASYDDRDLAEQAHTRTSVILRGRGYNVGEVKVSRNIDVKIEPKPLPMLDKVIMVAYRSNLGNVKSRVRGWNREGRTELTRGSYKSKSLKVLVAVDISGSMSQILGRVLGIAKGCKNADISVVVWADTVSPYSGKGEVPNVGFGTNPIPMLEYCRKENPDVLVVVTDGEFNALSTNDYRGIPSIYWLLTFRDKVNTIPLRKSDRLYVAKFDDV